MTRRRRYGAGCWRWQSPLLPAVLALALAACASGDKPKPSPLEAVTPQINAQLAWSTRLSSMTFMLAPTVRDGVFTVADGDGTVLAVQAQDGRERWRGQVGTPIGAGVGSDGRFSAVVSRDNELLTLEAGVVKWRQRLPARVTAAPLVAGERVFVVGVDRAVHAFDAFDGRKLWSLQRPGDALTLSQPGVVAPFKNTLLVGQGPRLAAVDPLQGVVRWDVAVASPRGTNEVERLADLVGPPLRLGDTVCTRAFQSTVGCVDAERGTLTWSRNVGGLQTVGGDKELLFGADASDRITAWRTANGEVAWTTDKLAHRGLSGPLALGRAVIFGDAEGQLHFLDRSNGQTLLRLPTDGSAVIGTPVASGSTMLVVTRKGGLFAFRLE